MALLSCGTQANTFWTDACNKSDSNTLGVPYSSSMFHWPCSLRHNWAASLTQSAVDSLTMAASLESALTAQQRSQVARKCPGLDAVVSDCCTLQARKLAALQQRHGALLDGGKSVGISVGASMLVASVAGCVNVLLTNPICEHVLVTCGPCPGLMFYRILSGLKTVRC